MLRVPSHSLKSLRRKALFAVVPFVAALPAFAQTVSPPAPPLPAPPATVTSTPDLFNVGDGGCVQQYNAAFSALSQSALDASAVGLAAQAVGAAADVVGLTAGEVASAARAAEFGVMTGGLEVAAAGALTGVVVTGAAAPGLVTAGVAAGALAGTSGVETAALAAQLVGAASNVTGLASSIAGQVFNQQKDDLTDFVVGTGTLSPNPGLPFCELTFTGTVAVNAGGVNVSGVSIFNDDVRINGNLDISGDFAANQVNTAQGISAHGGAIFLGNPDGISFFEGITLGGGALAGAGFGGALAFTGDVSAIAIGNGARAEAVNSLALGTAAMATGVGGTALGAMATTATGISIGNAAGLAGDAGVAVGNASRALDTSDTAIGNGATVTAALGTAVGANTSAAFTNSAAFGANARSSRPNQQVFGTASNTYTMPGITSPASRSAQVGRLEVATTDSAGNLATDGGDIFNAIARVQAGVAVAMAIETPELATGEKFGIRFGWGGFDSFQSNANAVGVSAVGVLGRDLFGGNNRLALDAGAGWGWSEFKDYNQSGVIAGRAGMQFTW